MVLSTKKLWPYKHNRDLDLENDAMLITMDAIGRKLKVLSKELGYEYSVTSTTSDNELTYHIYIIDNGVNIFNSEEMEGKNE